MDTPTAISIIQNHNDVLQQQIDANTVAIQQLKSLLIPQSVELDKKYRVTIDALQTDNDSLRKTIEDLNGQIADLQKQVNPLPITP